MKYTTLGHSGIEVSALCVGCMSFGKSGTMHDWTLDEKATARCSVWARITWTCTLFIASTTTRLSRKPWKHCMAS